MPAPLNVDKEQVRMLVLSVGVREAARQCGIKEATVQDWSAKGKWLADTRTVIIPAKLPPPASMRPTDPTRQPADALADTLRADGNATKLAAMRYARLTSNHAVALAETAPDEALEQAGNVKQVLQAAAIAGGWAVQDGQPSVSVNLLVQNNLT